MVIALSSTILMSSHVSSWTNPTWFASMKQCSHIMLQRFVRSTVSTDPRPCWMVLLPFLVLVATDVAARADFFAVLEEGRVDGHDVLEVPVEGAVRPHQHLAV